MRTASFINLLTPKEKAEYSEVCWDILQKAYANIGGFGSAQTPEDLAKDTFLWKLNRKGGKIVAVRIYKAQYGRKAIASATDGSHAGKAVLMEIFKEDLTRAWTECSGAVEKILMRMGGDKYIVPAEYAAKLTNKSDIEISEDGLHYTRKIADHRHEKVIIGSPTRKGNHRIAKRYCDYSLTPFAY